MNRSLNFATVQRVKNSKTRTCKQVLDTQDQPPPGSLNTCLAYFVCEAASCGSSPPRLNRLGGSFPATLDLKLAPPLMVRERRGTCRVWHSQDKPGNESGPTGGCSQKKSGPSVDTRLEDRGPDALPVLNGEMSVEGLRQTAYSERPVRFDSCRSNLYQRCFLLQPATRTISLFKTHLAHSLEA